MLYSAGICHYEEQLSGCQIVKNTFLLASHYKKGN